MREEKGRMTRWWDEVSIPGDFHFDFGGFL